jgi:hypothetical protein
MNGNQLQVPRLIGHSFRLTVSNSHWTGFIIIVSNPEVISFVVLWRVAVAIKVIS